MDTVIKAVLDSDWSNLQKFVEKRAAEKVNERIQNKKIDILAKINGVTRESMQDVINIKGE